MEMNCPNVSVNHNNQRNKFNFRFCILQWFQKTRAQSPTALMGNGLGLQLDFLFLGREKKNKNHTGEGEHCSIW